MSQVEWDYAPTGNDQIDGVALEDNEDAVVFTEDNLSLIGQKYMKASNFFVAPSRYCSRFPPVKARCAVFFSRLQNGPLFFQARVDFCTGIVSFLT